MQRIFLIGYMGVGKTSIGVVLAKELGLSFIDLDQFIEKRYNKSVSQIFAEKGESCFRDIEARVLNEVSEFEDVVVSTGGGAPCFHGNIQKMNETGISVYLKTTPERLAKRLEPCKGSRPLLKNKTPEELRSFIAENLQKREPFYSQAKLILDVDSLQTDADVTQIALQLTELLKQ